MIGSLKQRANSYDVKKYEDLFYYLTKVRRYSRGCIISAVKAADVANARGLDYHTVATLDDYELFKMMFDKDYSASVDKTIMAGLHKYIDFSRWKLEGGEAYA